MLPKIETHNVRRSLTGLSVVVLAAIAVHPALAQTKKKAFNLNSEFGGGIVGQFDKNAANFAEPATITAGIAPATVDQPAIIFVSAQIAPNKHAYSLTQPPGGPRPTKIDLNRSADYRLLGPFRSEPAPNSRVETGPVWTGLKIEEHEGQVTWYAPIEITAGINPKSLEIAGQIHMEVCETGGSCVPVDKDFTAGESQLPNAAIRLADWPPATAIGQPHSTVASIQLQDSAAKF